MNSESLSESVEREWKRVIAQAVQTQRALKEARREAWRAARGAPDARCRETARDVTRGALHVRALLLAHAWLRGRPAWSQERRARERHDAVVQAVAAIAGRTSAEVRAWLEQAVPEPDRIAYEAHLARVRAEALARRGVARARRERAS
ncbi:MAG: hypothetical protein K1X94_19540 [Sandaracinaceae bacterium]|nr:hypothetical protein [Sandaracinaceae bacterium]